MTVIKLNLLTAKKDRYLSAFTRKIYKAKMKFAKNKRPSSYPYLSGDSFRALADHIHDETGTFDPNAVQKGDIVFVNNPLTIPYLKTVHPHIKHPYILIEHNGDNSIDKEVIDLLDDKIIRFYAQDLVYGGDKVIPIPIGLENAHFHINGITSLFDYLRNYVERHPPVRKNRAFFFFNVGTNPKERGPAKEYCLKHPCMDTTTGMLSPKVHLKTLMTYKFVVSPPGNAIESCRTWEALYIKTIPIVKEFVSMNYFASLGLPIWIVKDWSELDGYSEADLAKKYDELMRDAKWDALYMDFWIKKIKDDQKEARKI